MIRWPWRKKKSDKESAAMNTEQDQDARLRAAQLAAERTNRLVRKTEQQELIADAHLADMRRVRSENGFAALILDYAFRGRDR